MYRCRNQKSLAAPHELMERPRKSLIQVVDYIVQVLDCVVHALDYIIQVMNASFVGTSIDFRSMQRIIAVPASLNFVAQWSGKIGGMQKNGM